MELQLRCDGTDPKPSRRAGGCRPDTRLFRGSPVSRRACCGAEPRIFIGNVKKYQCHTRRIWLYRRPQRDGDRFYGRSRVEQVGYYLQFSNNPLLSLGVSLSHAIDSFFAIGIHISLRNVGELTSACSFHRISGPSVCS